MAGLGLLAQLFGGPMGMGGGAPQPPIFNNLAFGAGAPNPTGKPIMGGIHPIMGGIGAGGGLRSTQPVATAPEGGMGGTGLPMQGMPNANGMPPQIAGNPLLSLLFGNLGSNQRFYAPNNNMPSMGGFGPQLLPLLMGILNGAHPQTPQQPQAPAPAAPTPAAPPGFTPGSRGLPGGVKPRFEMM